jgi:hypothetical protein
LDEALIGRAQVKRKLKLLDVEASRKTWLRQLAEARADEGDKKAEQEYRRLLRVEQQRKDSRVIRRTHKKLQSGAVSKVIAPDENGNMKEYTKEERHRKGNVAREFIPFQPGMGHLLPSTANV